MLDVDMHLQLECQEHMNRATLDTWKLQIHINEVIYLLLSYLMYAQNDVKLNQNLNMYSTYLDMIPDRISIECKNCQNQYIQR